MLNENKLSRDNMNIRRDIRRVTSLIIFLIILLIILVMQYLNMYIKHISDGRRCRGITTTYIISALSPLLL